MLKNRQQDIIEMLNDNNKWLTGKEISSVLSVSDRTVRADIASINLFYKCDLIISSKRFGYKIDKLIHQNNNVVTNINHSQSSYERCVYIIKELIINGSEMSLLRLSEKIFISEYSLDKDLKKIKNMLVDYPTISISKNKNYIKMIASEKDKRTLYKNLLTEEIKGNFMNLDIIANIWKDFSLIKVKNILDNSFDKYEYKVDAMAYTMIIVHLGVSIERILKKNYIKKLETSIKLTKSIEYKISSYFYNEIRETFNVDIVEAEIELFAFLLLGKKSTDYRNNQFNEESTIIVTKIIENIKNSFLIDFSNDKIFIDGLTMHLISLLERKKNNISITNLYISEIKKKYPLVFEMAIKTGEIISTNYEDKLDENEVSFLALHLGAAYERAIIVDKYRVIIIVPYNILLANQFIEKISDIFKERIVIVNNDSFFEKNIVDKVSADLIITTVMLQHQIETLTVHVNLFLNHEDESMIFQALNYLDKQRNKDEFNILINSLVKKELFYIKDGMEDCDEVINFMCDKLLEANLASVEYKEDVFKREKLSSTSFNYGIAVPHSIEVMANDSCISTLILKKPLKWGDYEVRIILLLSIKKTENKLLSVFFNWLSDVVSDPNKLKKLLEIENHSDFMKEIMS